MSGLDAVGSVLADPTRAGLLSLLLDGRARTVTELARAAGVGRSTTSEHLASLRTAGFVAVEAQGRHRYHRLAGPEVAHLLETVLAFSARVPEPRTPRDLRFARTCYDHLAGALGVAIAERLTDGDGLRAEALAAIGLTPVSGSRTCLDWSERRPHLSGPPATALLAELRERRWLVPRPTPRALRLTSTGRRELTAAWGPHPIWAA